MCKMKNSENRDLWHFVWLFAWICTTGAFNSTSSLSGIFKTVFAGKYIKQQLGGAINVTKHGYVPLCPAISLSEATGAGTECPCGELSAPEPGERGCRLILRGLQHPLMVRALAHRGFLYSDQQPTAFVAPRCALLRPTTSLGGDEKQCRIFNSFSYNLCWQTLPCTPPCPYLHTKLWSNWKVEDTTVGRSGSLGSGWWPRGAHCVWWPRQCKARPVLRCRAKNTMGGEVSPLRFQYQW